MKRKRYSVEQIVAAVKQHDMGLSVGDIARKLGIAEQTFYRWKKQYGGLEATEVREATHCWRLDYNERQPHDVFLGDVRQPSAATKMPKTLVENCLIDREAYGEPMKLKPMSGCLVLMVAMPAAAFAGETLNGVLETAKKSQGKERKNAT